MATEYLVVPAMSVTTYIGLDERDRAFCEATQQLNDLAARGWEIVSSTDYRVVCRREIP